MAGNFEIKKANYVSILEADMSKAEHLALTHSVEINVNLLRQVFTTAVKVKNQGMLGFKFKIRDRYVTITETDLNVALQLPSDNFEAFPTSEELDNFFRFIECSLEENQRVPKTLYMNHLPKE